MAYTFISESSQKHPISDDLRVIVDGVDTVPLLEDHDQALPQLLVYTKDDFLETLTATVERLKRDGLVTRDL